MPGSGYDITSHPSGPTRPTPKEGSGEGVVDDRLDAGADVEGGELAIPALRSHPITEEDVDDLIGGVDPEAGAGEACMTIGTHRRLLTGVSSPATPLPVEAERIGRGPVAVGGVVTDRLRIDECLSTVATTIEEHLTDHGTALGVAKETRIATHATQHSCRLIVHVPSQGLMAEEVIPLPLGHLLGTKVLQRSIA